MSPFVVLINKVSGLKSVMEEWKPIPGYECFYECSSEGRLRSLDRTITYKSRLGKERKKSTKGRLLSPYVTKRKRTRVSYEAIALRVNNVKKRYNVHRLVLLTFVGPCPKGMEARHLNGVSTDNRLVNLVYGTKKENEEDRKLHGGFSRTYTSPLTEADVHWIDEQLNSGVSSSVIAERLGVNAVTVLSIHRRKSWKDVPRLTPELPRYFRPTITKHCI